MCEIKEYVVCINREPVKTLEQEISDEKTDVQIEVGTTGFKGSKDRKNGGRTYFKFECLNGDFYFEPIINCQNRVVGIEIVSCGDAGLNAMKKAFEFAASTINDQCNNENN